MSIRFVAYRPGAIQLNTLNQIAIALRTTLETTESIEPLRGILRDSVPSCVFACDQDTGMEAVQALEQLSVPKLLSCVLCPRPSIAVALRAGLAGAKDVFDHTYSSTKIAETVAKHIPEEERNCLTRKHQADFLTSLQLLSAAEHEVLRWVLHGEPNKLIARRLNVSQRTIEARRHKVFKKMRVKSLAHLVRSIAVYTDIDLILCETEADNNGNGMVLDSNNANHNGGTP